MRQKNCECVSPALTSGLDLRFGPVHFKDLLVIRWKACVTGRRMGEVGLHISCAGLGLASGMRSPVYILENSPFMDGFACEYS